MEMSTPKANKTFYSRRRSNNQIAWIYRSSQPVTINWENVHMFFVRFFFFCFDHLQHLMERIKSRLRSDVIQHNLLFRSFFFLFGVTPNGWTVQAHERINFFYELVAKMLSHRNISIMPIATSSEVNYPFRQTPRSVKLNSNYAGTAFSLYSFCR